MVQINQCESGSLVNPQLAGFAAVKVLPMTSFFVDIASRSPDVFEYLF